MCQPCKMADICRISAAQSGVTHPGAHYSPRCMGVVHTPHLHPLYGYSYGFPSHCFCNEIKIPLHLGSEHYPSRLNQTPHRMQLSEEPGHQHSQADDKPHRLRFLSSDHRKLYPTARCGKLLRGRSYHVLRPLNGWVRPLLCCDKFNIIPELKIPLVV